MSQRTDLKLPEFITFTGADDVSLIPQMVELSSQYPIEWGILFNSKDGKRVVKSRYPSSDFINALNGQNLRLAAHICGELSEKIIEQGCCQTLDQILFLFKRAQLNTTLRIGEVEFCKRAENIQSWSDHHDIRVILQCRDEFPINDDVDWLYDQSGGRGLAPVEWPLYFGEPMVGFAGGLSPESVSEALEEIGSMNILYWLDMETGIRTDDKFDMEKCRRVCQLVYGDNYEK